MLITLILGFHISEVKKKKHISTCNFLIKYSLNVSFLKQIVMEDEKQILYSNVEWKRLWG